MGSHCFFQGIFLTQVSNPGLLHWQADSLTFEPQRKEAHLEAEKKMNKPFGQPNVYPLHTPFFNSDCMFLSMISISNEIVKISENIRELLGEI